jgi:hypothetical protein
VAGLAAPPAHGQGNGIAAQASHGSSLGCGRSGAGSSAAIAAAGSQQTSCTNSTGDLQEITTGIALLIVVLLLINQKTSSGPFCTRLVVYKYDSKRDGKKKDVN